MKLDYDSISPITNNKCVLEEANEQDNTISYLCMESGFTTHERLKEGSDFQKHYETRLTELMLSCKIIDDNDNAWYPTFMQMPGGMLYAEGKDKTSWRWKVAQIVPILLEEREQYPVPGKENEYYTTRLDVENADTFDNNNFESALAKLYSVVKEAYTNEN